MEQLFFYTRLWNHPVGRTGAFDGPHLWHPRPKANAHMVVVRAIPVIHESGAASQSGGLVSGAASQKQVRCVASNIYICVYILIYTERWGWKPLKCTEACVLLFVGALNFFPFTFAQRVEREIPPKRRSRSFNSWTSCGQCSLMTATGPLHCKASSTLP